MADQIHHQGGINYVALDLDTGFCVPAGRL